MKKTIIFASSVILFACSAAFGQQEVKKEKVQKYETRTVKKEAKTTAKPAKQEQVKTSQPVELRKAKMNNKAVERKVVRVKANQFREEKKED